MSALFEVLGRFHPLVIHFPIALFTLGFLFVLLMKLKRKKLGDALRVLCILASLSAIISSALGLMLADSMSFFGAGAKHLFWHKWIALSVTGLSIFIALYMQQTRRPAGMPALLALFLATIGVSFAGHFGGIMVHGDDHFSPGQSMAGLNDPDGPKTFRIHKKVEEVAVDIKEGELNFIALRPVIKRSCLRCHDAQKRKGGLRLDTLAYMKKGGENGPAITPGDKSTSLLYQRITLPQDDEDYMPSKGIPLTDDEVALVGRWIDEGAP